MPPHVMEACTGTAGRRLAGPHVLAHMSGSWLGPLTPLSSKATHPPDGQITPVHRDGSISREQECWWSRF